MVWDSGRVESDRTALVVPEGRLATRTWYTWQLELGDDTAPLHPKSALPRLPDIEAQRGKFDIVSFATEPGDLVIFHPGTLHGGAPTHRGQRRRTLTLRFFGTEGFYDPRDGGAGPSVAGLHERKRAGDPLHDPAFLKLR